MGTTRLIRTTWFAPTSMIVLAVFVPQSDAARRWPEREVRAGQAGTFPRIGIAVRDTAGVVCAEFVRDSTARELERDARVTVVFPEPSGAPAVAARLTGKRTGQCWAAFPQPRWEQYDAYGLDMTGPLSDADGNIAGVALVVAGETRWSHGVDGSVHADLDGDGAREEVRRCFADEGEHLTIWSIQPGGGRVRRWHEYFDWGAFTDPTCGPGESGLGDPAVPVS